VVSQYLWSRGRIGGYVLVRPLMQILSMVLTTWRVIVAFVCDCRAHPPDEILNTRDLRKGDDERVGATVDKSGAGECCLATSQRKCYGS